MDYKVIFDYLTVPALTLVSFGILEQWWRTFKTRSAEDIVSSEVAIRFSATGILFVKLLFVQDVYLIIGQAILLGSITLYAVTLFYFKWAGVTE